MSDNTFGLLGIYIVAPIGVGEDWILPGTCLKSGWFGFDERYYLDLEDKKDEFEQAIITLNKEEINKIFSEKDIKNRSRHRKKKEGLTFSKLCEVGGYSDNIKVTAIVGENGSGKTQLLKELKSIYSTSGISNKTKIDCGDFYIDIFDAGWKVVTICQGFFNNNVIYNSYENINNNILGIIDSSINQHGIKSIFNFIFNIPDIYAVQRKGSIVFAHPQYILSNGIYNKGMRRLIPALILLGYFADIIIPKEVNGYYFIYDMLDHLEPFINKHNIEKNLFNYIGVIEQIFFKDKDGSEYLLGNLTRTDGIGVGGNYELISFIDKYCKKLEDIINHEETIEHAFIDYEYEELTELEKFHKDDSKYSGIYPNDLWLKNLESFIDKVKSTSLYKNDTYNSGLVLASFDAKNFIGKGYLNKLLQLKKNNGDEEFNLGIDYFDIYDQNSGLLDRYHPDLYYSWDKYRIDCLSSGEYQFLCRILSITEFIGDQENYIICIDEPDAFLHIKRQKQYIYRIVLWLGETFPEKSFHFIIATHSPFIVSDLPENNLLILEKGEDVTKNYVKPGDNKNSFASTTYGVVSQFMGLSKDEGTLGDFTKSILENFVIKHKELLSELRKLETQFLNGKQVKSKIKKQKNLIKDHYEKYRMIIDNIGDEFLKVNLLQLITK